MSIIGVGAATGVNALLVGAGAVAAGVVVAGVTAFGVVQSQENAATSPIDSSSSSVSYGNN